MSIRSSSSGDSCGHVLCRHQLPAILQTTWKEGENYGKRFYTCPRWKVPTDHCKFFKWYDNEKYGPRAIEVISLLRREIEELKHSIANVPTQSTTSSSMLGAKLVKCQEEKSKVELHAEKLRVKKNLYKSQVLFMKEEIEKMRCSYTTKSDNESAAVKVLLGAVIVVLVLCLIFKGGYEF